MGMVFNMAGGPPLPLLTSPGSAGDLRAGTQLIDNNGDVLTGTLPEVEQATPTISVSDGGLITASANQAGGIVSAGSKNATGQLATQAAKTVTPGTTQQTAVPAGVYTTGAVTVQGDANLVPENIAEGVSIFGVTGTLAGGGEEFVPISGNLYNITWGGDNTFALYGRHLDITTFQPTQPSFVTESTPTFWYDGPEALKNSLVFIRVVSGSLVTIQTGFQYLNYNIYSEGLGSTVYTYVLFIDGPGEINLSI